MEVLQYGRVLRRWKWMIVGLTALALATSLAVSLELPKVYQAKAVALVNPAQVILPSSALTGALPSIDQLVQTYVQLVNSPPVQQRLISDGIPRSQAELSKSITAKREPNTTLIDITINDHDAAVAQRAAEDVIPAFNQSLSDLQGKVQPDKSNRLEALVPWQVPTQAPQDPISPRIPLNLALALVGGLLVSVGLAFLMEYLDNSVRSEYDIRTKLGMTLLGTIVARAPERGGRGANPERQLVTVSHPNEPISEAYRAARTNLLYASPDRKLRSVVVSSSRPGEGKTTTACNLAVAMAQSGLRIILVDADFRKPQLHKIFRLSNKAGLGHLILRQGDPRELIHQTAVTGLRVVCSGPTPPNPSELLGSSAMRRVLDGLVADCNMVIFDSPPVGAVTDATVLGRETDGVVLVVEQGRTPIAEIERARETLTGVNAHVVGVVLNKMRAVEQSYYYYQYRDESREGGPSRSGRQMGNSGLSGAGSSALPADWLTETSPERPPAAPAEWRADPWPGPAVPAVPASAAVPAAPNPAISAAPVAAVGVPAPAVPAVLAPAPPAASMPEPEMRRAIPDTSSLPVTPAPAGPSPSNGSAAYGPQVAPEPGPGELPLG